MSATLDRTRFASTSDLAQLPWFGVEEGRIFVRDASVGPVIDFHAHLALAYGLPMRVDLERAHEKTEHYLPVDRPLDLEVYINKNLSEDDLSRLSRDLTVKSLTAGGMRRTHTAPNLAREMGELGVRASVLLPIDMPVLSGNARAYLEVARRRKDVIAFGSVHPYRCGVEKELDAQIARGARGLKVHPAVQLVPPEDRRAIRLYDLCGERGIPVFFHCGPVGIELELGRALTQVRRYRKPIEDLPRTTFVLGHSGALQMEEALELARTHENVWLELSSQSLGNVRRILDEGPLDRIVFGSDWPFYHQAIGLAKVLVATEGRPDVRRRVLHDNAARLLGLEGA
ncbi:MAG TPA: amidohydrolase family protein [Planctomycetota bacterium]|nr:amidohydrolase family protein [Planctomycetota bacterium]